MVTGTCGRGYSCYGSQAAERDRRSQKEATLQRYTPSGLFLLLRPYLLKLPVDETKLSTHEPVGSLSIQTITNGFVVKRQQVHG